MNTKNTETTVPQNASNEKANDALASEFRALASRVKEPSATQARKQFQKELRKMRRFA